MPAVRATAAASPARLSHRAGIIFAEKFRIVIGQRAHQFQMKIVHHGGASVEKIFTIKVACGVDGASQRLIQIVAGASGLDRWAFLQSNTGDADAGEALRTEVNLLVVRAERLP